MQRLVAASGVLLILGGCASPPSAEKTYDVRGQIVNLRPEIRELRLAHEEIPGYMPAMTMSFAVKEVGLLEGLERGDRISATLVVTETDAWLSRIEKTGHDEVPTEVESEGDSPALARPALDLLEAGQQVPEDSFVDQDGRPFSLADARGRVVALTFIYTRCPLPTFCPRMDRNFLTAQRAVSTRPDLRGRVLFVTVSFDPSFDTPAVLKQHAASIGADLDSWRFLTADAQVVDPFATRFGVSIVREDGDAADITHNLRTAVIAPDGRLVKVLAGGDWTGEQLVAELTAALTS